MCIQININTGGLGNKWGPLTSYIPFLYYLQYTYYNMRTEQKAFKNNIQMKNIKLVNSDIDKSIALTKAN